MREMFKGFYDVTPEEEKNIFESDKTIFVFDTNCFLNLYRCEEETKKDFITVVDDIKDRLWFPFQVGFEYQRNRLKVISDSLKGLNEIKYALGEITKGIDVFCNGDKNIKNKYNILHDKLISLKSSINDNIESFIADNIETRINKGDYISNSDDIRRWVDSISQGKLSSSFTQSEIDEINKDGDVRYKSKIGPGWMDEKEKGEVESYFNNIKYKDKFGDLYLWKELLKKSSEDGVDNIVFITNDIKEDWWYRIHGKTIGSLEGLKTEITTCGLKNFKMYNQSTFIIKFTEIFKSIKINESSIKELEMLNEPKTKVKPKSSSAHYVPNAFKMLYETTGLSQLQNNNTMKMIRDFNDRYAAVIELSNKCDVKKQIIERNYKSQMERDFLQQQIIEINEEISELEGECIFLQGIVDTNGGYDKEDNDGFIQELESTVFRISELESELEHIKTLMDGK